MIARMLHAPAEGADEGQIDEQHEFEVAFRQVRRSAFLLARHLGRRTDEATDIVQEAALRAWRYRASPNRFRDRALRGTVASRAATWVRIATRA